MILRALGIFHLIGLAAFGALLASRGRPEANDHPVVRNTIDNPELGWY